MNRVSILFILALLPSFLTVSIASYGQVASPPAQKLLSSKYEGSYSYSDENRISIISVYPETDTTILFYLNIMAPGQNNKGSMYGRVLVSDQTGPFETESSYARSACKLSFNFLTDSLSILTVAGYKDCAMGTDSYADGIYKKHSGSSPNYFIESGKKVYYDETKPEDYYKQIMMNVENNSRYTIKQLEIKNSGSSVYFGRIKPGNLSATEAFFVQGDSGNLTVQLVGKRFLKKAQSIIIHQQIRLVDSSNEKSDYLNQPGKYTLRIEMPDSKDFRLQTSMMKQ